MRFSSSPAARWASAISITRIPASPPSCCTTPRPARRGAPTGTTGITTTTTHCADAVRPRAVPMRRRAQTGLAGDARRGGEQDTVVAGRGLVLVGARRPARAAEVLEIPVGAVRGLRGVRQARFARQPWWRGALRRMLGAYGRLILDHRNKIGAATPFLFRACESFSGAAR